MGILCICSTIWLFLWWLDYYVRSYSWRVFGLTHLGSILGAIATTFGIGGAVGPVFAGYTFDVTGSYTVAFSICIVMFIIVAALFMFAKKLRKNTFK